MSKVRAKFECIGIEDQPQYESKHVVFMAVIDESVENRSFSKNTPSGSLNIEISYDTEASNAFQTGKQYYLDFTEAE